MMLFSRQEESPTGMAASSDEVAQALLEALYSTLLGRKDETLFDNEVRRLRPTASDISRALALTSARNQGFAVAREVVTAYLQAELTREHVAAQRQMSRTMEKLTWWLLGIGATTVILTAIAVGYPIWHDERAASLHRIVAADAPRAHDRASPAASPPSSALGSPARARPIMDTTH